MAYALIANTSKASPDHLAITTDPINTTNANLLIIVDSCDVSAPATPTDSKSNSWTGLTAKIGTNNYLRIWYSIPTSVGAGHTFTSNSTFASVTAMAFSGAAASSVYDGQETGAVNNVGSTSLATGAITPSQDNCLVITGHGEEGASVGQAVDSGFATIDATYYSTGIGGAAYGGGGSWKVQTTPAASVNPTWSWTTTNPSTAVIASFKAAASNLAADQSEWLTLEQQTNPLMISRW